MKMKKFASMNASTSKLSLIKLPRLLQITPVAVYFIIVLLFFSRFSQDMSVDGVSYVEIARLYLNDHLHEAINGFWSPLISWLLVPLLAWELSPDIAFKIITISAGLIALVTNGALVSHCVKSRNLSFIIQCAAAVMIASFALLVCTPDILGLAFSLLFIVALINSLQTKRFSWIFIAGILLAISYFAKTFFLPFGICVAVMFPFAGFALHHSLDRFRYDIINTILICCIAAVLVMPWVIAIHAKYGEWTIGAAGKLNFNTVMQKGNTSQLIVAKTAVSPFQDATTFALSSGTKIDYHSLIVNLSHNLKALAIRTVRHYPLVVISVILAFITIQHSRKLYWQNTFILGLPVLLLWTAYSTVCAFVPQQAYVWLGDILLLNIMAIGLEQSGVVRFCPKRFMQGTIALILILFWIAYPIAEMTVRNTQGVREKESGIILKQYLKENNTVITDSFFNETLVTCFWASAKYRGQYPGNIYLESIGDADYYLRWNKDSKIPQGFKLFKSVNLDLGTVQIWKGAKTNG